MSEDDECLKGQFNWSRLLLGMVALATAILLITQYFRFLMDDHYKIIFRLVVFSIGHIVSLIFGTWAAVLISKKYTCPSCREGFLVVPLSELYFFLPSLPWSPRILSYFTLKNQEGLLLKDENGKITGVCPICKKQVFEENYD